MMVSEDRLASIFCLVMCFHYFEVSPTSRSPDLSVFKGRDSANSDLLISEMLILILSFMLNFLC